MKPLRFAALGLAILAASCATITAPPGTINPEGPSSIPSTPLALGDYRNDGAGGVLREFENTVASRYGEGVAINAVTADLRRNDFSCAAGVASDRGDPPNQVCRHTVTQSGCTHTWQVHLYGGGPGLTRARALYDRRCGNDGLLGGPG